MTTIATLTLNPSLDISTMTDAVVPTHKLRCEAPRYDPGGGGINVARVVRILGGEAVAVFPAGGPAGQRLQDLLEADGVDCHAVPIAGLTRESFTVDDRRSGSQYRFVLPGPELTAIEQQRCLDQLSSLAPVPAYIVASGSRPPGVPPDVYARVARLARDIGARLILDTSGEALRQAGDGVYLIKPNLRELQDLVGRELRGDAEQVAAARALIARGLSEVVVLSLGADGAILVTADGHERYPAIDVPVSSAVGAGDSMVGAIALGLVRGLPLGAAVCFGMAAGAAALITPGTELCRREDVERIAAQMRADGGMTSRITPGPD